jgi:hypothetical protein
MNRQERRRQAAIQRSLDYVEKYVHLLPEVAPENLLENISKPGITHTVFYHDDLCRIFEGGCCSCNPSVRHFAEPIRS